jgi:serine/threonine-protein kinase
MGFQRDCVLKLVPSPNVSGDPALAQELAHEARICSKLNHPAVVRMHDFFEHGDNLVLVFEHFAGVSLARLLSHFRRRRQRVPDTAVWYLSHRLFGALAHAHALIDDKGMPTPVIHRDIQPAHLVVSQDAHVRLAGFGIAKIAGTVGTTAVGFVKGTPAYMAPEQASGEKISQSVDVYAAGLVVWEMLSGRSVVPARDIGHGAELLKLIAGRRFDPISSLRRDIPREMAAAIDACLVPLPAKRTIQCREVERWLEKVVDVEAGKKELRERLVQLRNANVRGAPAPRTSAAPRPSQPPPPHAMPSRYPGLSTRVTGRPSERVEGESPRSSRRAPSLRASSYPAPPLSDPAPSPSAKPVKRTLMGLAPVPPAVTKPEAPAPDMPSHHAMPPPPQDAEASRFVAGLKKPPGVQSARPAPPVVTPQIITDKPLAAIAAVEVRGHDPEPTGDTTIVSRRRFDQAMRRQRVWILGGLGGLAALLAMSVGGYWLLRSVGAPEGPAASDSVPERPLPAVVATGAPEPAVPVASPPVQPAPAASSAPSEVPIPSDMPGYLGAVLVKGPPDGTVYVSGVPLGETGEWIQISCNRHHFVRVGTKPGPQGLRGTSWLSQGQSVLIRCAVGVEVSATPRYPVREGPAKETVERDKGVTKFDPSSPF